MQLENTIDLMISKDYKDRFKAEYYQLENRIIGLTNMINNYYKKQLAFKINDISIYEKQLSVMTEYLNILTERAKLDDIKL